MNRTPAAGYWALAALTFAGIFGACSENSAQPKVPDGSDAAVDSGGPDALVELDAGAGADADATRREKGTLTLTLDPALDGDSDDVKATSLVSTDLLDDKGAVVARASVAAGAAVFDLASVPKGDYFLRVNGDDDDLVPTRIDDPAGGLSQRVGQKLRASYIGPIGSPMYRISTWSAGQKESSVVRFADDKVLDGAHPYLIFSFASSHLELRVLGSARMFASFGLARCPGHPTVTADGWLLNTTGEDHHGDVFNADGGGANCGGCHMDYWMKKPSYGDISPSRGWCFKCHDGTDGTSAGFVDSTP